MRNITIVRKRTVVQICTKQYCAKNKSEALKMANQDQLEDAGDPDAAEGNEWSDLNDVIEYPTLTKDDILESCPAHADVDAD